MKKSNFRNIVLSVILLMSITLSVVWIAYATAPNPGHSYSEIAGGVVQGDLLYGSGTDALSALAKNTSATRYLSNTGASNNPAWAQVNLTTGVLNSLPVANGGTGTNTLTLNNVLLGNGTSAPLFVAPGAAGTLLESNGTTWVSAAGGVLIGRQTLTAGTVYTPTAGTTAIFVRMVGGGGGGAGATAVASGCDASGGGGSGAYAEKYFTGISGTYSYAIGTAGSAGTVTGNGGAGGSTTFTGPGAVVVTAPGGSGSTYTIGAAAVSVRLGGAGAAVATNGDVNIGGQPGANGICVSGTVGVSGSGAQSNFGSGGLAKNAAAAGVAGLGYGSGGSGGLSLSATGVTGGAGTQGAIVVWEFR